MFCFVSLYNFMQKLSIQQQLSQKLSPQQIQFIKLLQIPAAELESRIEEELEINVDKEEIAKAIYRFMKKFFDNITYDLILDSCTLIKDVSKK